MNTLEARCAELSYRHGLTHVSSVLNTVNILDFIYGLRKPDDPVVLGNSHAALALYVVLDSFGLCDVNEMIQKHGTHASRDMANGIWVSGGSLGQAETIAVGMAIADSSKTVYLVTSDGACAEGSVWEAFRLAARLRLTNLKVTVIANGFGGNGEISIDQLHMQLNSLNLPYLEVVNTNIRFESLLPEWLWGLKGHYINITHANHIEVIRTRMQCYYGFDVFVKELPKLPGNYLEIGVYEGYAIRELARNNPDKNFYAIDPFIEDGNTSMHNGVKKGHNMPMQKRSTHLNLDGVRNVKLFEQTSQSFANNIDDKTLWNMNLSCILIDGDHSTEAAASDLKLAARALKKGGLIFLDDSDTQTVGLALAEFVKIYKHRLVNYSGGGVIWMSSY